MQVLEQYGTFWAHSHSQLQYTDGILMPFISHSSSQPCMKGRDYDEELIVFIQDWYHDEGDVLTQLVGPGGYNNSLAAPPPQSILINGKDECPWRIWLNKPRRRPAVRSPAHTEPRLRVER